MAILKHLDNIQNSLLLPKSYATFEKMNYAFVN